MTDDLPPRTPCFLVGLVTNECLLGRVVEVMGRWPTPDDEAGDWYEIQAQWAQDFFPGYELIAPRHHLQPLTPPAPAPTVAAKLKVSRPAPGPKPGLNVCFAHGQHNNNAARLHREVGSRRAGASPE